MKNIIHVFFLILIFGCKEIPKSNDDKLKEEIETKVISNLNDPKSYEFISLEVDTLSREKINNRIKDIKSILTDYRKDEGKNKLNIEMLENELQSSLSIQYPADEMEYLFRYRAKNPFNATIIKEEVVVTDLNGNYIEMYEKSR